MEKIILVRGKVAAKQIMFLSEENPPKGVEKLSQLERCCNIRLGPGALCQQPQEANGAKEGKLYFVSQFFIAATHP